MRNLLVLFAMLFYSFACFSQDTEWITVKSIEKGYRIDFPGEAKDNSQDVQTEKGTVIMHTYQLQPVNSDNLIYMTSFTEYPESFFSDGLDTLEKQTKVLNNSVNGAVTNTKGTLVSDEKILFNGFNGRKVKISINPGGESYIITMKIVLTDFKLYLVQTIALKGKEDNLDGSHFFDSFELISVKQ